MLKKNYEFILTIHLNPKREPCLAFSNIFNVKKN